MKPVKFDRHAKRRMRDRGVDEEETRLGIANPDFLEPSVKGRTNAFKFSHGRYLRVTFREEGDNILVITVAVRKKPFGRPQSHEDRVQQER